MNMRKADHLLAAAAGLLIGGVAWAFAGAGLDVGNKNCGPNAATCPNGNDACYDKAVGESCWACGGAGLSYECLTGNTFCSQYESSIASCGQKYYGTCDPLGGCDGFPGSDEEICVRYQCFNWWD
jgi:hypothetical protein